MSKVRAWIRKNRFLRLLKLLFTQRLSPFDRRPAHASERISAEWQRSWSYRRNADWTVPRNVQSVVEEEAQELLRGEFRYLPPINFGVQIPSRPKPRVLIAAQPKSGSKFLEQFLAEVFGLFVTPIGSRVETGQGGLDSIYIPRAVALSKAPYGTISHSHATPAEYQTIERFGFSPFVTVRNISDALVSRRDMLRNQRRAGSSGTKVFGRLSDSELLDHCVIRFSVAYVEFFATWRRFLSNSEEQMLWAEDWFESPEVASVQFARVLGLQPVCDSDEALRRVGRVNFNRGVSGRGRRELKPWHWEIINTAAAHYGIAQNDRFLRGTET